jgi:hypothetical protein
MKKHYTIGNCLLSLLALPVLGAFTGTATATSIELQSTFDYPGAVSTQPQKINGSGVVAGVFIDSSGAQKGFVRFKRGNFSDPLVDPDDTGLTTQCRGINNSNLVCGDYLDASSGAFHGFFLRGAGFHNYDVPGSTWTIVLGLNNVADFSGSDIPASGTQSGFVSIGGVVTEFLVSGSTATLAYQINNTNQACGYYIDADGITHGYYRDSDGSIFAPIDPAGSTGTIVFGNNNANWIVGRYPDSSGVTHGFLFIPPDEYVTYDFPGSIFTSLNGISSQGQIVGRYDDSSGLEHGIVLRVNSTGSNNSSGGTIPHRQASALAPVKSLNGPVRIAEPEL